MTKRQDAYRPAARPLHDAPRRKERERRADDRRTDFSPASPASNLFLDTGCRRSSRRSHVSSPNKRTSITHRMACEAHDHRSCLTCFHRFQ